MAEVRDYVEKIAALPQPARIAALLEQMQAETRYVSMDQARIITRIYQETEREPTNIRRARSLRAALREIPIRIDPGELIVGNRTPGIRGGVVFPEGGICWVNYELETLPSRPQDRFEVTPEDIRYFREVLYPYWKGSTLEDAVDSEIGNEARAIARVVKINQKDHAQGHICPNTEKWLRLGPAGLLHQATEAARRTGDPTRFYEGVILTLEGAQEFMRRYAALAREMAEAGGATSTSGGPALSKTAPPSEATPARTMPPVGGAATVGPPRGPTVNRAELRETARICDALAERPPATFHEALQAVWFLYVILHMESNASSFSPGRMDQYLLPYFHSDVAAGSLDLPEALELIEALWLKFNQIVYLRSSGGAKYFAGFPIGFNVAIGGQDAAGRDASNELSFLFLQAQAHTGLPQPNLSARLFDGTPADLLDACTRVIGRGSGMPQIFNDEAVIPALTRVGISEVDARNYAIVGCVELTTHGNNLGWSDAAMFNMVKALELTLNGGIDLLDGSRLGLDLGTLADYETFEQLEEAFARQIDHFIDRMIPLCHAVDRIHGQIMPSPFLSSVVDDCIVKGTDVTNGGAHYNLSGIQAIQPANVADSLAALRSLVYEHETIRRHELLEALRSDFQEREPLRQKLLNNAPKYGNDTAWVDEIAHRWVLYFADRLAEFTNRRGGPYHTGLYTVSAHVPMGQNVGATPDGRHARQPLADGGMSAVYGRDKAGPTALLRSVSRVDSILGSNGTLLNMKFSPQLFATDEGIDTFSALLRAFVRLRISHVQFNVLRVEDLLDAVKHPENYRNLTVRVAGYTAYFTELAQDLQQEIIARTTYAHVM